MYQPKSELNRYAIFRVALGLTIAHFGHFVNEIAYYKAKISHMV